MLALRPNCKCCDRDLPLEVRSCPAVLKACDTVLPVRLARDAKNLLRPKRD